MGPNTRSTVVDGLSTSAMLCQRMLCQRMLFKDVMSNAIILKRDKLFDSFKIELNE